MGFFKKLSYSVLNKKTPEQKVFRRIQIIRELMRELEKPVPSDSRQLAKNIASNYYVDSITIAKKDGTVVMTTEDNGFEKTIKNSSLYEYVKTEYPESRMITIKDSQNYHILYADSSLLYLIKSTGEMSILETKALVDKTKRELEERKWAE